MRNHQGRSVIRRVTVSASAVLGISRLGLAQAPTKTPLPMKPHVVVNLASTNQSGVLPFDEAFAFVADPGDRLLKVDTWYARRSALPGATCSYVGIAYRAVAAKSGEITRADLENEINSAVKAQRVDTGLVEPLTNMATTIAREAARLSGSTSAAVRHTSWSRVAKTTDSVRLDIQALHPSREYTFCFSKLSALAAADSAQFVTAATNVLLAKAEAFFADTLHETLSDDMLNALQDVLRSALLPLADTLVVPTGSVLSTSATQVTKSIAFNPFDNANGNHRRLAMALTREARTADPHSLAGWLDSMGADAALHDLEPAAQALKSGGYDRAGFVDAGILATALTGLTPPAASSIAWGETPITVPRGPINGGTYPPEVWNVTDPQRWATNLDTTYARLTALRMLLTELRAARPTLVKAKKTTYPKALDDAALARLYTKVDSARRRTELQRDNVRQFSDAVAAFLAAPVTIMKSVVARELVKIAVVGTTQGDYDTRARWHISQDLGILWVFRYRSSGGVTTVSPYIGVNIYVRPVNKRAPVGLNCVLSTGCASLTLGITTNSVGETDRYTGAVSGKAPVFGVGTRIGDFFRVSFVMPVVYSYDKTPAHHQQLTALSAVSASIDADLLDILGALGKALFP